MTLILNPLDASAYESRAYAESGSRSYGHFCCTIHWKELVFIEHLVYASSLCQFMWAECFTCIISCNCHMRCDSYMRVVLLFSYPFYGRVKWYSLKARQLTRWQEHGSKTSLTSKSTLLLLSLAVLLLISWDFTEGDLLLSAFSFNNANISRVGG